MYFGRGSYDPSAAAEAQTRLRDFQGATAISSNAYFGREEENEEEGGLGGDSGMGAMMPLQDLRGELETWQRGF